MLITKLFSGLAAVLGSLAFLGYRIVPAWRTLPSITLKQSKGSWILIGAFGWHGWLLWGAAVCAILGLVALSTERWLHRSLNRPMGLTSLLLMALAFSLPLLVGPMMAKASPLAHRAAVALFTAMFAFVLSCLLFVANVVWTFVRIAAAR